jgi:hypothetical protein
MLMDPYIPDMNEVFSPHMKSPMLMPEQRIEDMEKNSESTYANNFVDVLNCADLSTPMDWVLKSKTNRDFMGPANSSSRGPRLGQKPLNRRSL